jgi:hypothetical protein
MTRVLVCALFAAVLMAVARPAFSQDEPEGPAVMIEVLIVQLNAKAAPIDTQCASQKDAIVPQPQRDANTGSTVLLAPRDRNLLLFKRVLPWQPYAQNSPPAPPTSAQTPAADTIQPAPPAEPVWNVISRPRLVISIGQAANVSIGSRVPYMVKRPDGSLVVEYIGERMRPEGLSFDARASEATAAGVWLDVVNFRLSQVVGREPIPDVPFDVGKPIFATCELSSPKLWIPADQVAVFVLTPARGGPQKPLDVTADPPPPGEEQPICVLLAAKLVEKQP